MGDACEAYYAVPSTGHGVVVANLHSAPEIVEDSVCCEAPAMADFEKVSCNACKVSGKGASKATSKTGALMTVLHIGV